MRTEQEKPTAARVRSVYKLAEQYMENTKTKPVVPAAPRGIIERLKAATSIEAVAALVAEFAGYTKASEKTVRRFIRALKKSEFGGTIPADLVGRAAQ